MGVKFNIDEIFEIAEQIERNGAAFYRKTAGSTRAVHSQRVLGGLADMELQHEKTFKAMRAKLAKLPADAVAFDPQRDAALYLQAFADGFVFPVNVNPADRLTGKESLEEILRVAIVLEKDSIAFYVGIRELVPAELGKEKIETIIREEMSHVTLLSQERAQL